MLGAYEYCGVAHSCGLKVCEIGLVQCDRTCEVLMMAWSEIRMYLRKQSLDHLPRLLMSHFGHPMAAAVVAAPILREWDVVLTRPHVVSDNKRLMSFLVRNLLL